MQPTHFFRYYITILTALLTTSPLAADEVLWQIGNADNSAAELCLGEGNYSAFLENDFGFEDRFFVIGHSEAKRHFAYVIPGPKDQWAGTGIASGWRTHDANILFTLKRVGSKATATLRVDLVDVHPEGCSIRVKVNNKTQRYDLKGTSLKSVEGDYSQSREILLSLPLEAKDLRKGDNIVTISGSTKEASWWKALSHEEVVEATAITHHSSPNTHHPSPIYNLQGQRVQKASHGVYIVNGRKVIR
jgi:hypothetical protein